MVRAVAWGAGSRWAIQIFTWVATIVVVRLVSPYDYGLVGMAAIYLNLAALVTQIGIPDAIITLRDLTRHQIAELNTVSLLVGAVIVAVSAAMASPLALFFAAPPLRAVVIVVSTQYIINAFQVVPRALLQKELRFKLLAFIDTARALAQMLATVAFAWTGYGYWSLVYGHLLGGAFATALTLFWRPHGFAYPHFRRLYRELRFSGHVTLSGIGWYVYSNADFLVAGRMLGGAPLGDYSVAWTISSAPIEKIGNLLTGVTPAFFSAVQEHRYELRRYFLGLTEALSYVTVPASIGIVLVADYLVPVLLGPRWAGVVGPLRLLGVLVAFRSLTTMLPRLLTAMSDTRFVMWTTVISATVMPVAFVIGSRWGTSGIATGWIVMYPLVMAPLYHRIFQRIGISVRDYLAVVMPALGASLLMALVLMLVRSGIPPHWPLPIDFAILVVAGVLSYAGILFAFHQRRLTHLFRMVRAMRGGQAVAEGPEISVAGSRLE